MSTSNNVVDKCFWCGKPKRELKEGDKECGFKDYDLCGRCGKKRDVGIMVCEVTREPYMGQPPISDGMYPTGKWAVTELDFFDNTYPKDFIEKLKVGRFLLLGVSEFRKNGCDKGLAFMH